MVSIIADICFLHTKLLIFYKASFLALRQKVLFNTSVCIFGVWIIVHRKFDVVIKHFCLGFDQWRCIILSAGRNVSLSSSSKEGFHNIKVPSPPPPSSKWLLDIDKDQIFPKVFACIFHQSISFLLVNFPKVNQNKVGLKLYRK